MAQQRNRRLRKKLRVDEFQELGFSVAWRFPENMPIEEVDHIVDNFILELIEPQSLALDASGYLEWEGLVCLQKIGKCTEEHRQLVERWLTSKGAQDVKTSELFDLWWGE